MGNFSSRNGARESGVYGTYGEERSSEQYSPNRYAYKYNDISETYDVNDSHSLLSSSKDDLGFALPEPNNLESLRAPKVLKVEDRISIPTSSDINILLEHYF